MDWIDAIDASRNASIAFGTATAGLCLLLAVPLLWWTLPNHRVRVFAERADPKMFVQLAYGIAAMAMAWADALCRYLPHPRLGVVHPAFFVTTVLLVAMLAPRVARRLIATAAAPAPPRPNAVARRPDRAALADAAAGSRLSLILVLALAVAIPIVALANAFAPHGAT
jgi:hypothetical protein